MEPHNNKRPGTAGKPAPGEEYTQVAKVYPNFEHVDWQHAPLKWKLYRGCPTVPLGSFDELAGTQAETCSFPLSSARLSQLLAATYGLTRQHWTSVETLNALIAGTTMAQMDATKNTFDMELMRSVPSGGGLFPAEIYLALAPGSVALPLAPGLYHYDMLHHALDLLDPIPMQPVLTQALARSDLDPVSITLLLSCSFWKTAFKYGAFGYRLHSLDLGVLVAQCLEVAHALHLSATVHYQFLDRLLNQQVGLDPLHESVYAVITLTSQQALIPLLNDQAANTRRTQPGVLSQTRPISDFPLLEALHNNALYDKRSDLRAAGGLEPLAAPSGVSVGMPLARPVDLLAGLKRRHSARNFFQRGPLSYDQFTQLLQAIVKGYENDLDVQPQTLRHILLYCLVNQIDGMVPGAYCYVPTTGELVLVRAGDLREEHQAAIPPMNAQNVYQVSLCLFPVGCYTNGFRVYGDRWYRMQNMEAGICLQRLYLAASVLQVGCQVSLTYSVEALDRLLQLPNDYTVLAQALLAPERISGQFYELPLIH